MGSYNVSCGVSRISIGGGDPVVLIPLVATKYSDSINIGSCYVSNDGPKGRYYPLTLPLVGEYNDYGGIENIVKDCNTAVIEKFYGCSIEDFAEHMCSCRGDKSENETLPTTPSAMFVRKEIYEHLINNPMSEYGDKKESAYSGSDMSSFMLRYLGFVEGEKYPKEKMRYNRSFRHPKIPEIVIWSDDRWIRIGDEKGYPDENKVYQGYYHPDKVDEFLKKKKLFIPPQMNLLKKLSTGDIQYDLEVEQMLKNMNRMRDIPTEGKTEKEIAELTELFSQVREDLLGSSWFLKLGNWSDNGKQVRKMYKDCFALPEFKKLWVNYKQFESMLYHVNAPLMPSWNGLQCGNLHATLSLANVTAKLCKAKIKRYKDESED